MRPQPKVYEACKFFKGAAALHGLWAFLPRMHLVANNASGDASVHKPAEVLELKAVSSSTYEVTSVVWVLWSVRRERREVIRMSGREGVKEGGGGGEERERESEREREARSSPFQERSLNHFV